MIQKITRYISGQPLTIQVAKDGNWEDCWLIDLKVHIPKEQEIEKYLTAKSFHNLALEVVFPKQFIFGLIFRKGLQVTSPKGFIINLIQLALTFQDFKSFCQDLEQHVLGFPGLFTGDPDLIRIGVVNHWFSVGPVLVWEKGDPKTIAQSSITVKLSSQPKVLKTKLNYQGLSFIYATQDARLPYHWIKSPCSQKEGLLWVLDMEQIKQYLGDWVNIKIE